MSSASSLHNVLDLKSFAFETGLVFRGLSISPTKTGFRAVLRGFRKGGQAVYALGGGETPQGALDNLWAAVCNGAGDRLWAPDNFYSS